MNGLIGKNECLMITDATDRAYFSGEFIPEGCLIVSERQLAYFTDMRYYETAVKKFNGKSVKVFPLKDGALKTFFNGNRIKRVGVDYAKTTVKDFAGYKKLRLKLFDCEHIVSSARAVKTETEIGNIRKACEITEKSFYSALPLLKEGITEKEFKEKLVSLYLKNGAESESFDTIVAFGTGSAIPHYETGEVKLKKNSVVLIDTGCRVNGYCSDFTRTLFFGEPDEEFIKVYNAVLSANVYAESMITEGVSLKQADGFARESLIKAGYGENFTHSLGHGVGLEIHERPYLSPRADGVIKENNVFTVEPGAYFYGKFGVRIEDTLVLKNGKAERLFKDDKKLIVIK